MIVINLGDNHGHNFIESSAYRTRNYIRPLVDYIDVDNVLCSGLVHNSAARLNKVRDNGIFLNFRLFCRNH